MEIESNQISIFMPVYNGSKYLNETIETILNQTYKNFELFCVDDSSTDDSYQKLTDFSEKDARIKVFIKENGGIVPKSWNYILPHLKGEFIFYMSQDDLLSKDVLQKMVDKYMETKAETILPDLEFYFENRKGAFLKGINGDRSTITGKEALIASIDWSIHGFALRKRELLQDEFFPEDSFDADEYMTRKLFAKSKSIAFSEGLFQYRQDNSNALTKNITEKNLYSILTLQKILELLINSNVDQKHINYIKIKICRVCLTFSSLADQYYFKKQEKKEEIQLLLNSFRYTLSKKRFYDKLPIRYSMLRFIFNNDLVFTIARKVLKLKNKSLFVNQ